MYDSPRKGSPSFSQSLLVIPFVRPQLAFVVQMVFTTSSKTVGHLTERPAPISATQRNSGCPSSIV